ncbi:MAG: efflux RND transporter permease subunit, partial [Planctomycetota bacterium]
LAFTKLPVNDLPAVDYPVITVNVNYPGASPTTMANNIATPLERQFMQIAGLELVTSQNSQGHSSFTLQFALNKSIDAAATDVQTAISQASGSLPTDLPSPPILAKTNPNDQAILYAALSSNTITSGKLYEYASTQVSQRVSIVPGVSRVDVYGTKSAVRIKADPDLLASRGIAIDELAKAVGAGTSYQAAGQFDGANRSLLLQPKGQLENATEFGKLIVAIKNGAPVYLKDVAEVQDSVADERVSMHFWARGAEMPTATCVIGVFRQAGSNAVEVAAAVRNLLPVIEQQLPKAVKVTPIYDRSISIVNSVKDVEETLVIAFVLVVAVIFIFLGRVGDTLIPALALPLSLLLTFIVMSILGYSLDNLSLMALTLAIGFLVDDAIVFLENTVRRMELGEERLEATINSAKEISFTIMSMTLSLAAVFLPLMFMPGLIGRIFREFAVTIIVSIIASGIVSLTLTPLMCARMLGKRGHGEKKTLMERAANFFINPIIAFYGVTLTWFLKHKWISALIWIGCMAGTVVLFQMIPKSFLPVGDSSFLLGVQIGKEGASPLQMRQYQFEADRIMQANPSVKATFTMSGNSGFAPSNFDLLLAFLYPPGDRKPISAVAGEMMGSLMQVKGTIGVLNPQPVLQISTGATANLQGKFAYSLSGIDPQETYVTAQKLMGKLHATKGIFSSVNADLYNNTPSLEINILRDEASSYGVSVSRIESLLRQAYSQNYVYLIKKPDDQYQVILEVLDKGRAQPDNLELLYVTSDDGTRRVPLKTVATWRETVGPQSVNHINQFTSVTIFFNLIP